MKKIGETFLKPQRALSKVHINLFNNLRDRKAVN